MQKREDGQFCSARAQYAAEDASDVLFSFLHIFIQYI